MTTEQNKQIPFVILEAHPDNKRPYVLPYFDSIEENKLQSVLLEKLVEFVYDRIDIRNLVDIKDIQHFWDNFYSFNYMDMAPWEARAMINGVWEYINIDDKDLLEELIKKTKQIQEIHGSNNNYDENSDENSDENTALLDGLK